MKKTLQIAGMSLALTLAFGFAFTINLLVPKPAFAEDSAVASEVNDAPFVDGNWFTSTGSVDSALQDQIDKYNEAVEAGNTADAEKYAIRSWVKANYAAELGRQAMEAGDLAEAKKHLERAVKLAKKAQKPGTGKGEHGNRVNSHDAPKWGGTSAIEGERAEAYATKLLNKVKARLGANG